MVPGRLCPAQGETTISNATPFRPGQANLAGSDRALFLSIFGGQVLEAFDRQSHFRDKHFVRVIPNGSSARFPVTGMTGAFVHQPGQEINGNQIRAGERVISIEDMIISPVFVSNIDELMAHYEFQAAASRQVGQALAKRYDQNVARTLIAASRGTKVIDDSYDGYQLTDADYATDGGKLWQALFNAGVKFDERDTPDQRYSAFRPVQYALLVRSEKPIDTDLGNAGNGSLASGTIRMVNNIPIGKTNNLVNTDDRADTTQPVARRLDYSPTVGLVWSDMAAGTVQLQDITMESAYDIRRQGDLMLGKYLVGHGALRPEESIEIRTGAPS